MNRENRWPWWMIIGSVAALVAVGTVLGRTVFGPGPPPPPEVRYLPGEAVPFEVESPATLAELASERSENGRLRIVAGELLDENGRLVEAVALLSVETEPAPPPEPEIVAGIILEAYETEALPDFRADFHGDMFAGLDEDGDLAYGIAGEIRCWLGTGPVDGDGWALAHAARLGRANTYALTAAPPEPARRPQRYYAGLHVALLRDADIRTFDDYAISFSPDRFRAYGGWRWFPLKPYSIRTGVFADARAVGVDVGLTW